MPLSTIFQLYRGGYITEGYFRVYKCKNIFYLINCQDILI